MPKISHRRRHHWNEIAQRSIPFAEAIDGNDRTEKTCSQCALVKITVHPPQGLPWREWRTKDGKGWVGDSTPPCVAARPELQVASETTTEVVFS